MADTPIYEYDGHNWHREDRMNETNQTNANPIYSRHDGLGIIQDQHVAIVGCGGIGSWISLYLGLAGIRQIDIYDSDTISETNLNRFPLGPDKIGANKAIAMAEHIQSLRRDVNVIPRQNFEPEIHREKLGNYSWVIVTTDSLKSRQMVYNEVVAAGKARGEWLGYIEAGADGHHGTITFSPAIFATEAENEPGYRSVPIFVGPCTLVASIVAYYVLLGNVKDYAKTHQIDWDKAAGVTEQILLENDNEIEVDKDDPSTVSKCPYTGAGHHNEIAARITHRYGADMPAFYVCANHLPIYQSVQEDHHIYSSIEILAREVSNEQETF